MNRVGDLVWMVKEMGHLADPHIITSVTPNITKYSHANQTTKIESCTVGLRKLTDEEVRALTDDG
ncbi:MAG: hypothetical protein KJ648_07650 [Candidatus Omnitrophica bacterium]|nr:hypothetical protein [Candidatus Omnitrophota bacterium]